jgi:hypothetical protein
MSDPEPELEPAKSELETGEAASRGPNLALIYSLIALAMAAAIGVALMIVMPFYNRR